MNAGAQGYGYSWGSRDAQENGIYDRATGRVLVPAGSMTQKQNHAAMCSDNQAFLGDIVKRYEARWK